MLQNLEAYNNSLQEIQDCLQMLYNQTEKDVEYKEKMIAENKPYVFVEIRINQQNRACNAIEDLINNTRLLFDELQQLHNKKNNQSLVEKYNTQSYPNRTTIAAMPTDYSLEILERISEMQDDIKKILKATNSIPYRKNFN